LFPRVSVSKQDIKHYYRNHPEKFQPGVQRKIRLIRVDSEADAKKVKKALKAGKSFKAVAGRKLNSFNRSGNGLLGKQRGERPLQGPLNKVLVELDEGEWGGPASFSDQYWFVFVESMTRREGKSLREVQLKIRNQLRSQRFRQLQQQYRRRLFKQGSFGSIKQMGEDLLRIAMSRYAPPPPES
jgi:parvulin-like peptidyl-prolyl isomerase